MLTLSSMVKLIVPIATSSGAAAMALVQVK